MKIKSADVLQQGVIVSRSTLQKMIKIQGTPKDRKLGPESVLGYENGKRLMKWIETLVSLEFPATKVQLLVFSHKPIRLCLSHLKFVFPILNNVFAQKCKYLLKM